MKDSDLNNQKLQKKQVKQQRLAAQLRENLLKRKIQARKRKLSNIVNEENKL